MMCRSLSLLYKHMWQDHPYYPVVIFHDDLTVADTVTLQEAVPHMPLTFRSISFQVPANLVHSHIPPYTQCAPQTSTLGYRLVS